MCINLAFSFVKNILQIRKPIFLFEISNVGLIVHTEAKIFIWPLLNTHAWIHDAFHEKNMSCWRPVRTHYTSEMVSFRLYPGNVVRDEELLLGS